MRYTALLIFIIGLWLPSGRAWSAINATAHPVSPDMMATPLAISTPVVARVKDIARVETARDNQLMGCGLVVGLNGTGDSTTTGFTNQAVSNLLSRMGMTVTPGNLSVKNVAVVMVTATIGPFLKSGDQIDVTISSMGDATSLQGGTLLQTPLMGADGKVYAVSQGAISLGGFTAGSSGGSRTTGHPTVGRIPQGALVEAEISTELIEHNRLSFALNNPDYATATRMAEAINIRLGANMAHARDAASVDVTVPDVYQQRPVELIASLGELELVPDTVAKVVINERTGTVIVGGNVTVMPVALAQGNLTVSVNNALMVSQPTAHSNGTTVTQSAATVATKEPNVSFTMVQGSTVDELVRTLNGLKVGPRDIIAILQGMKQAGALQAELEII